MASAPASRFADARTSLRSPPAIVPAAARSDTRGHCCARPEDAQCVEASCVSIVAVESYSSKGQTMNRILFSLLALFALATKLSAGGCAIITLNDFPDYAIAGKPINLTFAVRQHGQTLLGGLRPTIRATTAGGLIKATVKVTPAAL